MSLWRYLTKGVSISSIFQEKYGAKSMDFCLTNLWQGITPINDYISTRHVA
jgi:hypothetical protein